MLQRLETFVPPPVVAAITAVLMWLGAAAGAGASAGWPLRLGLALAVAFAGAAIAVTGARTFKRARTTLDPRQPRKASSLVTGGIYRVTRNPMYLGLTCVLLGLALWLWWWPALAGPMLFVTYITRFQIGPEERALAAAFGAQYEAYCRRVRRWL